MNTLLQFDYINHNNEYHWYKVIPIGVNWERCKCFLNESEREAWVLRCLVLERSGEKRHVLRSFALIKMTKITEIPIES